MSLSVIKKRISKYLSSDKSWPIIVDLQSKAELSEIKDYFSVGSNYFLDADKFCNQDGTFKLEEFIHELSNNNGDTFVLGVTAFLKLQGEVYTHNVLKEITSKSISGHIIVLTYQCKNYLKFSDSRIAESGRIIVSPEEPDAVANICLISPDLVDAFTGSYDGLKNISRAIESSNSETIYVATAVSKNVFEKSVYNISQMLNGYDILCNRDARTKTVPQSFGTAEQWNYALKVMGCKGDWNSLTNSQFGNIGMLSSFISAHQHYNNLKKWLYYTVVSIFGIKDNAYLQLAINDSCNSSELIRSLYRALLTVDKDNPDFWNLYELRRNILKDFPDTSVEIVEFCKVLSVKEKDYIYYLTDLNQPEKERIMEWLDTYGEEFDIASLQRILRKIYPDLAAYLGKYRFKNDFLDNYFEKYKYQKVINKLLPSFAAIVDEQSYKMDFVSLLKPRTALVDKIDVSNAHAYFLDAMGVEYLGYIQAKCDQYGLSTSITCARCELPSLTVFNKEFVDTFKNKGCTVSDIKELDEIKHHGEDSFDYEKVKMPVYLISELEYIDNLLSKIKANIYSDHYKKAVIISDHGASRLAVLHNTENVWKMATSGVHSGRCCPKSDVDSKPDFAIEAENFWVLANYDRFQGGRKANCEVHGGATIEEVAVPIIEITRKQSGVEAFIVEESKVITLGAKETATIKIFVAVNSNNIAIKINGNYYDAELTPEKYIYTVKLPDINKKGVYSFDIINGSSTVAFNQSFEIKKKGMGENVNLFD